MTQSRNESIRQRVERLELPFNQYGIDPYGVSKDHLAFQFATLAFFYRHYFTVHVEGMEHVPPRGRGMLVGNHSGGVALDGAMVMTSVFLELEPPRLVHAMVERFINRIPFLSQWTNRAGQLTGIPEHAERLLTDDRLLLVFPEGAKGTAKLFPERHSLVDFGTGFMRLALKTGAPIIPFAFVGGGEAIPTIANAYGLGKLLGVPYIPITPYGVTFPLPVRMCIEYGEPLSFTGNGTEEDEVIHGYVAQVKSTIALLIERGRKRREKRA